VYWGDTPYLDLSYFPQLPWADVRKEMIDEKGLDSATADKIGSYVKHKGIFKTGIRFPLLIQFVSQAA
jgi:hypothetical protein